MLYIRVTHKSKSTQTPTKDGTYIKYVRAILFNNYIHIQCLLIFPKNRIKNMCEFREKLLTRNISDLTVRQTDYINFITFFQTIILRNYNFFYKPFFNRILVEFFVFIRF